MRKYICRAAALRAAWLCVPKGGLKKKLFLRKIQLKGVKLMYVCDLLFLIIYFLPDFIEPARYITMIIKSKRRPK
ncbi:MAG: hypothetical protein FWH10_03470 [Oscillospiraceae bacterium]|nr:hypothetical protein [Oscillospiraceae bacterium]